MVACYQNNCHYSFSGTNNFSQSKTEHKTHSFCSAARIAYMIMFPLRPG